MQVFYTLFALLLLGACSTVPPRPAPVDEQAATPPTDSAPMPAYTPPVPPLVTPLAAPVTGSLAKQPQVQAFIREMVAQHHF